MDRYDQAVPKGMGIATGKLFGKLVEVGGFVLEESLVDHYVDTYQALQPMRKYVDHMTETITMPFTVQETFSRNYESEI